MVEPLVRRDVWRLAQPWDAVTHAYALAVGRMKEERADDPPSWHWTYQTQVHGMGGDPGDGLRHQCQHNCWFFLPWHRWYLTHFERIVRAVLAVVDGVDDEVRATWALPYWDYNGDPSTTRFLPSAFREPLLPDGNANPLFESDRNWGINEAEVALTDEDVDLSWMGETRYSSNVGAPSFGGAATARNHLGEAPGARPGALELTPHGAVHMTVGGLMSGFATAGGDPVFWLHHCNVDRLWEVWRGTTGVGQDPTEQQWLDEPFDFLDETGARVTETSAAVLDTVGRLGYRYEDVGAPAPMAAPVRVRERAMAGTEGGAPPEERPPERVGASGADVVLQGDTADVQFDLDRPPEPEPGGPELAAPRPRRVILNLENITSDGHPRVGYAVYLRSADGSEEHFVGTIPLFGLAEAMEDDTAHELAYAFDVTAVVDELRSRDQWDPARVAVSFRPANEALAVRARDADRVGRVRVGSVSVAYQ
ncbi:MAG TPA: tyrosinase family protein [Acidimicrobiales bacterium]